MGIDYSYRLFIPQERLWDVIQDVAEFTNSVAEEFTIVQFPNHEIFLPFGFDPYQSSTISFDDSLHRKSFHLSLVFEVDEAIKSYIAEQEQERIAEGKSKFSKSYDVGEKVSIGVIYLSVYRDLTKYVTEHSTELAMLRFTAATDRMSVLFEQSQSIRNTFGSLLMKADGAYGILDREGADDLLIWWRGETLNQVLDNIWLPPDEIEKLINTSP